MSRVQPLPLEALEEDLQAVMAAGEDIMGFLPNDGLIMARQPALLKAMLAMVQAVYAPGAVDQELKKLVGLVTSSASGCQYCEAHTSLGAFEAGVSREKIAAIWEYPSNPLFSDAERAALDLARNAALVPNAVTDEQVEGLKAFFSDDQIVELTGVIALFGFLNRWNATLDTDLEESPRQFRHSLSPAETGR